MKIENIDKNFAKQENISQEVDAYNLPSSSFDIYGVYYDDCNKRFTRMPFSFANGISKELGVLSSNTSGGRVRFSTDSDFLEIKVTYRQLCIMSHMNLVGSGGFLLLEETEQGYSPKIRIMRPSVADLTGYSAMVKLEGGNMRNYTLYFPLYNDVDSLEISLKKGARVEKGKRYKDIDPILYYGSSITQGACATRPDNSYPAIISKWNNVNFINMGFSGLARGELAMAEYLSKIPCSIFVCDYDYNAFDVEYLKRTHFNFYKTFRKGNSSVPILFISKPDADSDNTAEAREKVIKMTYKTALKNGDKNVYFLSGKKLYQSKDRFNCSVDGCHPNDLGFYRMATEIYKKLVSIDKNLK